VGEGLGRNEGRGEEEPMRLGHKGRRSGSEGRG